MNRKYQQGFTLIELSVVLVAIGLLVGGILVGQDMIKAAEERAQISQIEKYNSAVNTFYSKYQALPGDMPAAVANQYGFAPRGQYAGEGDGNGVIEGVWQNWSAANGGIYQQTGETAMFWLDLNSPVAGNLIEGSFTTASSTVTGSDSAALTLYMPEAKIGYGNYVYVWSGMAAGGNSGNFFGLAQATAFSTSALQAQPNSLPVREAYQIDKKIDDGLPLTGVVTATYVRNGAWWVGQVPGNAGWTTLETTTTCYDNNGVAGNGQQYSMGSLSDYGGHTNCALSFRMQGVAR